MIDRTFREYYVITALSCFAHGVIAAMYVSYLMANGLNLFEVNIVNCIFFSVIFLAEIPTGVFADVFGRKLSFVTSCFIYACGMLIYSQTKTFLGFALSEATCAIAYTFASGACRAWFVDRLKHHGYSGQLSRLFVRGDQIGCVMGVTSSVIGAFLADFSMKMPWVIGAAVFVICGCVSLGIKEEYFVKQKFSFINGLQTMKKTAKAGVRYGLQNRKIRFIIVLIMTQVFVVQAPNMQWQPFFKQWINDQTGLGFIFAGISICFSIGSTLGPWLLRRVKSERKILLMCQIWTGLLLAVVAVCSQLGLAVGIFLAHEIARGVFRPMSSVYLHDNIPSKERATIDSFVSMFDHLGGALGLIVSGVLANYLGIPVTWIICGLVLVLVTLVVTKNGQKSEVNDKIKE